MARDSDFASLARSGRRRFVAGAAASIVPAWLVGCASGPDAQRAVPTTTAPARSKEQVYRAVNRMTWGATSATMRQVAKIGFDAYLDAQLHPRGPEHLTPSVEAQIAALTISQTSLQNLLWDLESTRKNGEAAASEEGRKAAQQTYQQELTRLAREAASRQLLRALYSEHQLLEHMTWFWFNHFNVHQYKHNIRAMVGDYEERAIRPHALGRFRDLLGATAQHPAMLRYLDNEQNAVNHINENYARELLELHTLGVDGGYQQRDVQELARVLTGWGVNFTDARPNVRREWASLYIRDGNFEFNPNRHDFGDKTVLGRAIRGRGADEVNEVLDLIAVHPSTAKFVSRRMAQFLLTDEPAAPLVDSMCRTFERTGGDIGATLRVLLRSLDFASPAMHKFKDPIHFVVSAVRTSYNDKPILNTAPMQSWLNRAGEGLYNRQTPDGYPLTAAAWTSSGQMSSRFELAKTIGTGSAGLFKSDDPARPAEMPAFPQLANGLYYELIAGTLAPSTRETLEKAGTPQEWNTLFLASPEFMYR